MKEHQIISWSPRKGPEVGGIRSTSGTLAVELHGHSCHRFSFSLTLVPVTSYLYLSSCPQILISRKEHMLNTTWVKCPAQAQPTMTKTYIKRVIYYKHGHQRPCLVDDTNVWEREKCWYPASHLKRCLPIAQTFFWCDFYLLLPFPSYPYLYITV